MLSSKEGKARNGCERKSFAPLGRFLEKDDLPLVFEINITPFSHDLSDLELVLCDSLGSTKTLPATEVTKESIFRFHFRPCDNHS